MDIEVVIAEDAIQKTKVAEVKDIIMAQDTKVDMVKDKVMTLQVMVEITEEDID